MAKFGEKITWGLVTLVFGILSVVAIATTIVYTILRD